MPAHGGEQLGVKPPAYIPPPVARFAGDQVDVILYARRYQIRRSRESHHSKRLPSDDKGKGMSLRYQVCYDRRLIIEKSLNHFGREGRAPGGKARVAPLDVEYEPIMIAFSLI
jgi:hypothetical protein